MNVVRASNQKIIRASSLTGLALIAFAANSILCRLALGEQATDPASYTAIRLVSGALALWLITAVSRGRSSARESGSWTGAGLLFFYAVAFSFAYLSLSAGTGALILFATVQFTMIAAGLRSGERPAPGEWSGWALAAAGFVYLVLPGFAAPPLSASLLMAAAGIAWGFYSLLGRGIRDPISATAGNFLGAVPFALIVVAMRTWGLALTPMGIFLAILSGAITSGLGYVVWYAALPRLTATRAATVQLAVPIVAALGGVLLLGEQVSARLLFSAAAILGGIGFAITARSISKSFSFAGRVFRRKNNLA